MATIEKNKNFSAEKAAEILAKALKGGGTDEDNLIKVLTSHDSHQRSAIADAFEVKFGKKLIDEIKGDLSGKFRDAVMQMTHSMPMYLAHELRDAMKGAGTDEADLIEILCTRSNKEIEAIKECYERAFSRQLHVDIGRETSGYFRKLLLVQCKADREEDNTVYKEQAKSDAQALIKAGIKKVGTDEDTFTNILCERSYAQLRETFKEYTELSKHDIEKDIISETSGSLQKGYLAIVGYVRDSTKFWATRLYESMKGRGTDDDALVRILIFRSEVDLSKIAARYEEMYKKSLREAIKGECKGDYQNLLLAIVGGH